MCVLSHKSGFFASEIFATGASRGGARRVGGGCRSGDNSLTQCRTGLRPTARSEVFGEEFATGASRGWWFGAMLAKFAADTRQTCGWKSWVDIDFAVFLFRRRATNPARVARWAKNRRDKIGSLPTFPAAACARAEPPPRSPPPLRSGFSGGSILRRSAAYVARHNSLAMAASPPENQSRIADASLACSPTIFKCRTNGSQAILSTPPT